MDPDAPWRAIESVATGDAEVTAARRGFGPTALLVVAVALIAASLGVALAAAVQPRGAVEVAASGFAGDSPSPQLLVVEVAGAVARPGVYELLAGSRVADAIAAAGGYSADVDPRAVEEQLNLAARLQDAQLVRVPRRGDPASSGAGGAGGGAAATSQKPALIDLNTATAEELDTLPGVGPVTAQKIIDARTEKPFASVDELVARKVVTAATLAKFRSLVTAG